MGSKFSDPTPYLGGLTLFGDPKIGQRAYVGHLSTHVHNVGVFLWVFQGTELIYNRFKPTRSVYNQLPVN